MNISINSSVLFGRGNGLKSTQERLERKREADEKVDFYEQQKKNLKNKNCETVEEIADKLDKIHTYEEEIAAAKKSYNYEQMFHVLDESEEIGKKIAEAAEKNKPKTPEERAEEAREEVLGIEAEENGMLSELLDELPDMDEVTDAVSQEMTGLQDTTEEAEQIAQEIAAEMAEQQEKIQQDHMDVNSAQVHPLDIRV